MDLVGKPQEIRQRLDERMQATSGPLALERMALLKEHLNKSFPYAKL
jgi:hypothetical protein